MCATSSAGSPYLRARHPTRTHAPLNYAVVRFVRFFQNTLPLFSLQLCLNMGEGGRGISVEMLRVFPPSLYSNRACEGNGKWRQAIGPIFKHRSGKKGGRGNFSILCYVIHVPPFILPLHAGNANIVSNLQQLYNSSDSHLHLPISERTYLLLKGKQVYFVSPVFAPSIGPRVRTAFVRRRIKEEGSCCNIDLLVNKERRPDRRREFEWKLPSLSLSPPDLCLPAKKAPLLPRLVDFNIQVWEYLGYFFKTL